MPEVDNNTTAERLAKLESIVSSNGSVARETKDCVEKISARLENLTEYRFRIEYLEREVKLHTDRLAQHEALVNQARGGWKTAIAFVGAGAGFSHIVDSMFGFLSHRP